MGGDQCAIVLVPWCQGGRRGNCQGMQMQLMLLPISSSFGVRVGLMLIIHFLFFYC